MNTPAIKLNIFRKSNVELFPFQTTSDQFVKVGEYTLAHIEDMQNSLSQEEDVSDYMEELVSQVTLIKDYNAIT
jgi:hypothetical protein